MTAMLGFFGLREGEICLLDVDENGDVYVRHGELKGDVRALQTRMAEKGSASPGPRPREGSARYASWIDGESDLGNRPSTRR